MKRYTIIFALVGLAAVAGAVFFLTNRNSQRTVVVYTSVDQPFAEPILTKFGQQSGINIQPVYDVEASKTTGLVNRLIAEKDAPVADVFWNSEFVQTIVLKDEGVLTPYTSSATRAIPSMYNDPENYWVGQTGRARVIIVNTDRVEDVSVVDSIQDFLDEQWPGGSLAIANPLFGTTATHSAALYAALGDEAARGYFEQAVARGVRFVDGNSVVRDLVADGTLAFGLTDTDDACGAFARGAPVALVFPDQGEDGLGTLIVPSTVAQVAGAPHPEEAAVLIDYLLSVEVEQALIQNGFSHIAFHEGIQERDDCISTVGVRGMALDYQQIRANWDQAQTELREIVLR